MTSTLLPARPARSFVSRLRSRGRRRGSAPELVFYRHEHYMSPGHRPRPDDPAEYPAWTITLGRLFTEGGWRMTLTSSPDGQGPVRIVESSEHLFPRMRDKEATPAYIAVRTHLTINPLGCREREILDILAAHNFADTTCYGVRLPLSTDPAKRGNGLVSYDSPPLHQLLVLYSREAEWPSAADRSVGHYTTEKPTVDCYIVDRRQVVDFTQRMVNSGPDEQSPVHVWWIGTNGPTQHAKGTPEQVVAKVASWDATK